MKLVSRRTFNKTLAGTLIYPGFPGSGAVENPSYNPFFGWYSMSNAALATLDRVGEYGVNALIIEQNADHGVGWQFNIDALSTYDFLQEKRRTGEQRERVMKFRDFYRRITEKGKQRGVDVYLMSPEISYERGLFSGKPQAMEIDDDAFWDWVKARMREIYLALPDLSGFVLYLTESAIRDITSYVSSRMTDVEKTKKLIQAELEVAKEFKRRLIVSTFIHSPKRLEVLAQALRQTSPDPSLWILQYACPSDWGVLLVSNPAIGRVGKHPEIVAFDYCGENWGQGTIPFCQVDYMVEQWKRARSIGSMVLGSAGYTSWPQAGTALGTLNEVNIYAGYELSLGTDKSAEELIQSWIQKRYGEKAVPYLATPLRKSFDVVFKSYHLRGFWVDTGAKSQLASLTELEEYLWGDLFGTSLANWSGERKYHTTWQKIYDPSKADLEDFLAEKNEAVQLAEQSLSGLRQAREAFDSEDYRELIATFGLELDMARVWRAYTPVFFDYRMWVRRQKPTDLRDETLAHLRHFRLLAEEMEKKYDPEAFPVNPARLATIADSFEERLRARS